MVASNELITFKNIFNSIKTLRSILRKSGKQHLKKTADKCLLS